MPSGTAVDHPVGHVEGEVDDAGGPAGLPEQTVEQRGQARPDAGQRCHRGEQWVEKGRAHHGTREIRGRNRARTWQSSPVRRSPPYGVPAMKSMISLVLSAMMTAAMTAAKTLSQRGATIGPSLERDAVSHTSGTTANGS